MDIFADFDASYGNGTYSSMSDGAGGQNIVHDGNVVGHVSPVGTIDADGLIRTVNAAGGVDVTKAGQLISHSMPNAMGGENVYHGAELHHVTIPNVHGGVNVYDSNMNLEGMSMANGSTGGEDYLSLSGNTEAISQYKNPLAHSNECRFDPFDIKGEHL